MGADDTPSALRLKMLCVCVSADGGFDTAVENLLAELAEEKDYKLRLITRAGLDSFLWNQMARHYGYRSV